jgi:hypothetical protein
MAERWVGITVSGKDVTLVQLDFDGHQTNAEDVTWQLQDGARPAALTAMQERVRTFLSERKVDVVVVRPSMGNPRGGATRSLLESAELRGVVTAAAASVSQVHEVPLTAASKSVGTRPAAEYRVDETFWSKIQGQIRKGSRETALLVFAARPR